MSYLARFSFLQECVSKLERCGEVVTNLVLLGDAGGPIHRRRCSVQAADACTLTQPRRGTAVRTGLSAYGAVPTSRRVLTCKRLEDDGQLASGRGDIRVGSVHFHKIICQPYRAHASRVSAL